MYILHVVHKQLRNILLSIVAFLSPCLFSQWRQVGRAVVMKLPRGAATSAHIGSNITMEINICLARYLNNHEGLLQIWFERSFAFVLY
ncbi:transmembrane protein, putative [Medicago truncatula]|uniref:Transmembrane protein, putative n=1 Tax=Medicago truncatula TaxID=3880 RepID=A0A072TVI0_MEDTR|nr:transmembrane protein, putative [Medicago truncatula]